MVSAIQRCVAIRTRPAGAPDARFWRDAVGARSHRMQDRPVDAVGYGYSWPRRAWMKAAVALAGGAAAARVLGGSDKALEAASALEAIEKTIQHEALALIDPYVLERLPEARFG